ncbi:MAG: hypothetical protein WC121_04805 [Candidatus Kapaibacterium sp.]
MKKSNIKYSVISLFLFLIIGCSKEIEKLDLENNLLTFEYKTLKGRNIENLLTLIVQDSLDYMYIGDQDIVSGISIEYGDSTMIFVYFNQDESLDYFSDVQINKVYQNEINRIIVFKSKSASDEVINIDFRE